MNQLREDEWSNESRRNDCQGSGKGSSALYQAICKNLRSQRCPLHHKTYEYYCQQELQCEDCFVAGLRGAEVSVSEQQMKKWRYFCHLENIMNHPILLLCQQDQLFQYPIQLVDLVLQSYQPLFARKNDLTAQKNLLISFTNRIKNRVNALCDELLASFERAESTFEGLSTCRDEVKHLSKIYQDQFLGLLQQRYQRGSKEQIQDLLSDYKKQNESPFEKLFSNLDETMSFLSQTPVIDIPRLVTLYSTITDERLWRCSQLVSQRDAVISNDQAEILLDNEEVLLQGEFILEMKQEGLVLRKGREQLGRFAYRFDSLYPLSKYRLVGVNYDNLQIVSYFDRLAVQATFPILGCTELLAFQDDVVVVSNRQLIRIDLQTRKWSSIGSNFQNLRYVNKAACLFSCTNPEGKTLHFSLRQASCGQLA